MQAKIVEDNKRKIEKEGAKVVMMQERAAKAAAKEEEKKAKAEMMLTMICLPSVALSGHAYDGHFSLMGCRQADLPIWYCIALKDHRSKQIIQGWRPSGRHSRRRLSKRHKV